MKSDKEKIISTIKTTTTTTTTKQNSKLVKPRPQKYSSTPESEFNLTGTWEVNVLIDMEKKVLTTKLFRIYKSLTLIVSIESGGKIMITDW